MFNLLVKTIIKSESAAKGTDIPFLGMSLVGFDFKEPGRFGKSR